MSLLGVGGQLYQPPSFDIFVFLEVIGWRLPGHSEDWIVRGVENGELVLTDPELQCSWNVQLNELHLLRLAITTDSLFLLPLTANINPHVVLLSVHLVQDRPTAQPLHFVDDRCLPIDNLRDLESKVDLAIGNGVNMPLTFEGNCLDGEEQQGEEQ